MDTDSIKSFSYQAQGNTLTFEKSDDTWYYQPDHSIKIDQNIIKNMLAAVEKVTAEEKLEDVKDTSEYGFDAPVNVLTFTLSDGTRTITIGMQNEITNEYYIMDHNTSAIYIVNDGLSSAFSKTLEDVTAVEEATEENTTGKETTGEETTEQNTTEENTAGE